MCKNFKKNKIPEKNILKKKGYLCGKISKDKIPKKNILQKENLKSFDFTKYR